MELVERELLDAVAHDDRAARAVLADYWMERGNEELAARWVATAILAGFPARHLVFDGDRLRWPLAIGAGEPLDEQPDLFRLSPRYYREGAPLQQTADFDVLAAQVITPMRASNHARVVIKALSSRGDDVSRQVLAREHAILQLIDHRNVISSAGFAIRRNGLALVTPWAGLSLAALVASARTHRRAFGAAFAFSVALQLCDALEALHAAGIVHREIRTDHVVVAADGRVTVIDFGHVDGPVPRIADRLTSPRVGRLVFRYMSPEQVQGRRLDERTDLFSTMTVAGELVTGAPLFVGANDMDLLIAVRDCEFAMPPLPDGLAAVVRRTLVPRDRRVATAAELRDMIKKAAHHANLELGPHVIARTLCELGVPA